jgi:hypothetical protein
LQKGRLVLSGIVVQDATNLTSASAPKEATERNSPLLNSAWRQFKQGSTLVFGYAIYNATLDRVTQSPRLTAQARVFRDGIVIFTGNPEPVEVKGQTDLQRITSTYALQLGSEMLPGQYVVQIIITDSSGRDKPRAAMQWIDFDVVK